MPAKQFLGAIDGFNALFYSVLDIVTLVLAFSLLQIIIRSPKARAHRRWAIPYMIAAALRLLYRIATSIRLFGGVKLTAQPILLLYLDSWLASLIGIYGTVQLLKIFRELSRRHANEQLSQPPFEEWPTDTPAANSWDTSR